MRRTLIADRLATGVLWAIAILVVTILIAIIAHFLLAAVGIAQPVVPVRRPQRHRDRRDRADPVELDLHAGADAADHHVPLGTLGGIYMAEYAGEGRITNSIRFSQELISSVPSIVVGLFGLALFVNALHFGLLRPERARSR